MRSNKSLTELSFERRDVALPRKVVAVAEDSSLPTGLAMGTVAAIVETSKKN
ncbi:Uncharacterised protein [Chlamydia trachomatis]|nr:Uncharacterised protein [Chlamydia trachomatis]